MTTDAVTTVDRRCRCGRLADTEGNTMTQYLFEYVRDGAVRQREIRAVDSADAFDMFRADYPYAPISNIWVEAVHVGR